MQRRAADLVRDLSRALEAHESSRAGALAAELDRELADEDDSALISLRLLARSFVLFLDRRAAPAAMPSPVRVREDPFAEFGPAPTARAFVLQRSAIGLDAEHVRRAIRAGTSRRELWVVEVTVETDGGAVRETVLVRAPSETEARDAASAAVEAAHLGSSIFEVSARNA